MQRSKSLLTEAWRVYAIALLNVLVMSPSCFVHSLCDQSELDLLECGNTIPPTNKTNIVDLTSSGCNDTHIWISWSWTTPIGCDVAKVVINRGYTCFTQDGSRFDEPYKSPHWRPAWEIADWSYSHSAAWNTSKSLTECNINGYFEIDRPCRQKLLAVNITCSNQVQPTSTSYLPTMTSSSSAPITTTTAYTLTQETTGRIISSTLTAQPTPTITPQLDATFQTLSQTHKVIVITIGLTVALLSVLAFVTVMLTRWKYHKPINYYTNYDKDLIDFKPGFTPVVPDEVIFKEDTLSIKSTIAPLEKIQSALILTDISTAPSTQKLSQPKDYRQLG